MKKYFLSVIVLIISFLLINKSFAYDLTAKDKILVDNLTSKVEKIIEKKWEKVRDSLINSIKKLAIKYKNQPRLETILLEVVNNLDNNIENEFDNILNNLDKYDSQVFSNSQINSIIQKLDNLKNINYNKNTSFLNQWNFKAEYFPVKDYKLNTDKIVITIDDKKYEIPWVYDEIERKKYLEEIKKWWCKHWKDNSITEPDYIWCIASEIFSKFEWFSPSWYYILYSVWGYEYSASKLVDVKTWEVFLDILWWATMNTWTNDKAQFIYWQVGWIANEWWLYITIKWNFPKTKKINDYDILSWYVDDNYIYVKADIHNSNWENIEKLLIYNLKDLSLIYSK